MASTEQNLSFLMWILLAASLVVTWHSQKTKIQIASLQARMLQQRKDMQPLLEKQENRKTLNERRWSDVMNALQAFSGKIRQKENFLDTLKTQIRQHVLNTNKNASSVARQLLPLAEDLVVAEQTKKESSAAVKNQIDKTRAAIKNIVKQSLDTDPTPYFRYDPNEITYLNTLDQYSPILATHIRRKLWVTPSPKTVPYNLKNASRGDWSEGQWAAYRDVYKKNPVFFIECGGLDGEDFSNTLSMEMTANWTGALVEASPLEFRNLMNKKRKSILIPTCMSLEARPTTVTFSQNWAMGKIMNSTQATNANMHTSVHCMPFYAIYKAIGRRDIDLFVLDIEGHEMEILHTIPWDRVNILSLMVEFVHGKYSKDYMRDYMLKQGYRLYNGTKKYYWESANHYFIKIGSKYDKKHP